MSEYHALASPSSSAMWLNCANSLAMQIGQPEGDTKAADLGSDKHELLALCLEFNKQAMDYEGHILQYGHTVNKELATDVQTVLDNIRERVKSYELQGCTVTLLVEKDVPIEHITGEAGATGRVDVRLLVYWPTGCVTKEVRDAKFGYTEVKAENNSQLMMYGAGSLEELSLTESFDEVTLVIDQPTRGAPDEWTTTPERLADFVADARPKAEKAILIHKMVGERALKEEDFAPSEKTCQWCKAGRNAACAARERWLEENTGASFEVGEVPDPTHMTVEQLGKRFEYLEAFEDWIKAVRARIEHEVFAGNTVPGVKVVAGKRGNRQWSSDEEAEALMRKFKMRENQMYSFKLLGPKPILEALKDQPRRLKQIEALVTQAEGKPHVVHESDKRPAIEIKPAEDGFETVDDLC